MPSRSLAAAAAGVMLAVAAATPAATAAPKPPLGAGTLTKYVDPLPIPPVAQSDGPGYYELHMVQSTVKMHRDLPPTPVWGYTDGHSPAGYLGPTIVTREYEPLSVRWFNDLPTTHLLQSSIDHTLDGAMQGPDVRAVTHLHGGHVADTSDGGPDAWFLPGANVLYHYPNDQESGTLWYHDHALGITRLNPYLGLAGGYVIDDDTEDALNLPGGPNDTIGPLGGFDLPLIVQDKSFDDGGAQTYATQGILPGIHPTWVPEFFGDVNLVNGKVWPYLRVEPRKYRFRIVNGANARFYRLTLDDAGRPGVSPTLYQIGAEGGLLPAVAPTQQLLIAPGERADVIVDFSAYPGATLILRNTAKSPYPSGASPDPKTVGQVMQFRVEPTLYTPDTSSIPANPRPITPLDPAGKRVRDVKLTETLDPATGFPTKLQLEGLNYRDPVTLKPRVGSTEVWRLLNTTADTHPIHTHLVQFQVLDRQKFDVARYLATGQVRLLGTAKGPRPNERGWKDTVEVDPGEIVRIVATFDMAGTYPIHCHILEHEENEMMRPFTVMPAG